MKTKLDTAHIRDVKIKDMRIFLLILILGIIFHIGFANFKVDGESMESTYEKGERLLVNKIVYKFSPPELGDVIVFYDPKDDTVLVKRIIALPKDIVEIIEGVIFVNGVPLLDEYSSGLIGVLLVNAEGKPYINWKTGELVYEYSNLSKQYLREDEYYAIGDNRTASWFGIVKEENIIGIIVD
mgnify:FL=1